MYLEKDKNLIEMIKQMDDRELSVLCSELRQNLIENVSKTGGHLASNLGTVELTVALHRVFDAPKDKIVWDVGHQAYVHKMLTGRLEQMQTLRQLDGISGFPKITESPYDAYDPGHASTSISAALGYAKARDLKGEDYACVAVIGDGALTGGIAYEGLNCAGMEKTPLIVILNDNQMSIAKNRSALAKHLQKLRGSKSYIDFKENLKKKLKDEKLYSKLSNIRDSLKYATMPGIIFEELGFKYFGPIDGHDIKALTESLITAKQLKRPVLVHIVTKKGKGYASAENNPAKYHGIGPFSLNGEEKNKNEQKKTYSEVFGNKLLELSEQNEKIVAVSAAMVDATGLGKMQNKHPERVFDVGIAEEHAVSFAAGLALGGMKPVVAIYSTFLQRAYDQILIEICLQKLPVVFAVDRAGIVGRDGETHQGVFDISYLSSMPNMTVLSPKDGTELEEMLEYALKMDSPCAIRYPREEACDLSGFGRTDMDLKPELIGEKGDIAIVATGSMVKEALAAKSLLQNDGYSSSVYNVRCIKPLEQMFVNDLVKDYTKIITVEDGILSGGLGEHISAMAEQEQNSCSIYSLAWPDKFIEQGSVSELRHKYRMDAEGIAKQTEAFIENQA